MMRTSLNTKGQTVEWHTLFFQMIWYYTESVHFVINATYLLCRASYLLQHQINSNESTVYKTGLCTGLQLPSPSFQFYIWM